MRLGILAACAALGALAAGADELPREHACPEVSEGAVLTRADAARLSALLPAEVWRHRDVLIPDGMQIEVGPCHRRYPQPPSFRRATEQFAGVARLDDAGNLVDYTAGLPFPPEAIDLAARDAGARWAWNLERRDRGAGPSGSFRITELPGAVGDVESYRGSWFQLQTGYRSDENEPVAWIAGGRFAAPAYARDLAWRQARRLAAAREFSLPDDVFVYAPSLRKVQRGASAWIDGVFVPETRAPSSERGSGIPIAADPRGFTGLSIRPNAYVWRVLGMREVLAPLNAARGGYPSEPERSFGPSGLALAGDRWDVRRAVVIQGALREQGRAYDWLTLYVDVQTQQPLYVITERRGKGRLVEVGILVHRFSGDQPGYPGWPDGEPASVFDPVAALFFDARVGGGWRRESYDVRSTPLPEGEVRRLTSLENLERGR